MILTSRHHLQVSGSPLSSKDPPPEMEDRGSLDREDDHFRQRLLFKSYSKWWYWHLDTISGCQDAPYPPRIHHQRWRIGAILTRKMTISGKDCFTIVVPNDDTDIWTPSPDVRMLYVQSKWFNQVKGTPWKKNSQQGQDQEFGLWLVNKMWYIA